MIEKIDFDICRMYDGNEWVYIKTQTNFDRLFANNQSQGLARFYDDKGGAWVNSTGKSLTDERYKSVCDFSQGFALFQDDKGYAWVNSTGEPITDKRYNWVGDFTKEGFALFRDDSGWNWVNSTGKPITDNRYYLAGDFSQGFAWFEDDKGNGYINTLGFKFISNKFTWGGMKNKENFENNKKELLELEEKLLHDFLPKTSMKYYILTKVLT